MQKRIRQLAWMAICAAGLTVAGAAAQAGDSKITPPHLEKSAGGIQLTYPADAQKRGEEGTIDFALYISAGGHPTGKYKIYKSTGFSDLDNAALQSAIGWNYVPGRDADGDATSGWIPLHLEFKLPAPPPAPNPGS